MESIVDRLKRISMEDAPISQEIETHCEYCDILEERLCSFYVQRGMQDNFEALLETASKRIDMFNHKLYKEYEDALWHTLPADHVIINTFIKYFMEEDYE